MRVRYGITALRPSEDIREIAIPEAPAKVTLNLDITGGAGHGYENFVVVLFPAFDIAPSVSAIQVGVFCNEGHVEVLIVPEHLAIDLQAGRCGAPIPQREDRSRGSSGPRHFIQAAVNGDGINASLDRVGSAAAC
jgi:hypothetical protein